MTLHSTVGPEGGALLAIEMAAAASGYSVLFDFRHNINWMVLIIAVPFVSIWVASLRKFRILRHRNEHTRQERNRIIGFILVFAMITLVLVGAESARVCTFGVT
jgi:heme/copper-type cytochrome/quinol oxidase subunit 2